MKKFLLVATIAMLVVVLTGCFGNSSLSEGLTNESNTLRYAVIPQTIDGETYRILYPIDKWADSDSDAFAIKFTYEGQSQILWTSFNVAKAYHSIPQPWEYDMTYSEACKEDT